MRYYAGYGLIMILLGIMLAFFNQNPLVTSVHLEDWGFEYEKYWIVLDYDDDGQEILDFYGAAMALYGLVILIVGHKRREHVPYVKTWVKLAPILPVFLACLTFVDRVTWQVWLGFEYGFASLILGDPPFMGMLLAGFASVHLVVRTLRLPS